MHIDIISKGLQPFSVVLQEGIGFKIKSGCTLNQFLLEICGFTNDYIEKRIKTAFINQKPVDNYDQAIIHDQDIIGLSGAMPGLVGATFRKNSVLSPFRSHISFNRLQDSEPLKGKNDAIITLRLFNILINETGPGLLKKGVLIQGQALKAILETERSTKDSLIKAIKFNGLICDWKTCNDYLRHIQNNECVFSVIKIPSFQSA